MSMTRRTFILTSGLVAATPALASMPKSLSSPESSGLPSAVGLPSDLRVAELAGYDIPFRIRGWESGEELTADERILISINQSWRATWR